jgi:acyl-ACP thioesterase
MAAEVRSYETDARGRLRPQVLCRWLQEAATVHAAELGVSVESLIDGGVAWVLSRLQVVVRRWPASGDELVIVTWPEALDRLTTERRFELSDGAGEVVGSAVTWWLVLDLATRRPVRFPAAVAGPLTRHQLGDRPARPRALAASEPDSSGVELVVRRSDLDLAGHANNTSYVEWALEAVPDEIWESCDLAELDVDFRSECHRGATIWSSVSVSEVAGGHEIGHRLLRCDDGVIAALARTRWRRPT